MQFVEFPETSAKPQNTTFSATSRRMAGLDALRFCAALGVMLDHYGQAVAPGLKPYFVESGTISVQLFFVISGVVIMQTANKTSSAAIFLYRRVVRLYPAFLICLAIAAATQITLGKAPGMLTFIGNLTMLPRLLQIDCIDGVYWTLSYEWAFYFLIAGMLLWLRCEQDMLLVIWLSLVTVILWLLPAVAPLAILMNTHFVAFFACGMLISRYQARELAPRRVIWFGVLISIVYMFTLARLAGNGLAGQAAGLALLSATAAVVWLTTRMRLTPTLNNIAIAAGAASYPLYLVADQGLQIILYTRRLRIPDTVGVAICAVTSVIAAFIISHYLEPKLRNAFPRPNRGAIPAP